MKNQNRTSHRRERGQSMVELALSFTVLLILLSGVVDLGRAFFAFMAMRDAAQEGALYGSLFPADVNGNLNSVAIINRVRAASTSPINMNNKNITVTPTLVGSVLCQGNGIRVDVAWNEFPMIMPFWQFLMGSNTIPIHATIVDSILTPPCQ